MYIIGTSGFFYWDWISRFYPKDLKPSRWLEYYSKFFNGLEVNSSFYHIVSNNSIKNFKKYNLNYIFKANRIFTHFKKYTQEDIFNFVDNLFKLEDKFKGILFQFPPNFVFNEKNILYLEKLIFDFLGYKQIDYFVEFRHTTWFENINYLERFVKKFNGNVNIIHVDGKFHGNLMSGPYENINIKNEYFRFHGRGDKTYNYLYTDEEIKEFIEKIEQLSQNKENIYIFFNNTINAQAVENALKLKEFLNINV